jgi:hypothetical protein
MKNDESTFINVGNSSSVMCPVWSYSNDYNYIPNIKNGGKADKIPKTTIFESKITISTEEKTKTEKGGN